MATHTAKPLSTTPVAQRLERRPFPSVFQAWSGCDDRPNEPRLHTLARHDLAWINPGTLGLQWAQQPWGVATGFDPDTLQVARERRRTLQALNPDMVLLTEIRYRDAPRTFLPEGHPWWKRDAKGKPAAGWAEGGFLLLDYANPDFRKHVARRAQAVMETGLFDGVMLDWWHDDAQRLALVKAVRRAVGKDGLIIANTNDRTCPQTARYINGLFMECSVSDRPEKWRVIESTLAWAEANLRKPRINCLETWYQTSRNDLHLMRANATLALTTSDGFCLFSDPNPLPTPDHLHNWYDFWQPRLGTPQGRYKTFPKTPLIFPQWDLKKPLKKADPAPRIREFDGGTVVYNPWGHESIVVRFPTLRESVATGLRHTDHYLGNPDGDIFLKVR